MIRILHIRHAEIQRTDRTGTEDEIQAQVRRAGGIGRQTLEIRIIKIQQIHKAFDLIRSRKRIEIPRDDDRFRIDRRDLRQILKLKLSCALLQRQMHQKKTDASRVPEKRKYHTVDENVLYRERI